VRAGTHAWGEDAQPGARVPPAKSRHTPGDAARHGPAGTRRRRHQPSDIPGGRRIDVCGPAGGYTVTVTQEGTPSERIAVAAHGCDAVASASAGPGAPSGAPARPKRRHRRRAGGACASQPPV